MEQIIYISTNYNKIIIKTFLEPDPRGMFITNHILSEWDIISAMKDHHKQLIELHGDKNYPPLIKDNDNGT